MFLEVLEADFFRTLKMFLEDFEDNHIFLRTLTMIFFGDFEDVCGNRRTSCHHLLPCRACIDSGQ